MGFDWRWHARVDIPWGDGQWPDAQFFETGESIWQGDAIHDNPRFFKYRWRIWKAETAFARPGFLESELPQGRFSTHVFSFADAMRRVSELYRTKTPMIVHSEPRKRIALETPWDASRVPPALQAPAYDDDPDLPFHGHK